MADARVEKLAEILVDHSAEIKPGDRVAIERPLPPNRCAALCATILERGGYPHLLLELPDQRRSCSRTARCPTGRYPALPPNGL